MDPLSLCLWQARAFWLLAGAGFGLLTVTWALFRRVKYLRAALVRVQLERTRSEKEHRMQLFARLNTMQRDLLESFLREPTPTLNDLVEHTERAWRARQSVPPSVDPEGETYELRTRDLSDLTRR